MSLRVNAVLVLRYFLCAVHTYLFTVTLSAVYRVTRILQAADLTKALGKYTATTAAAEIILMVN